MPGSKVDSKKSFSSLKSRLLSVILVIAFGLKLNAPAHAQPAGVSELFYESIELNATQNNGLRTRRLITKDQELTVFYDSCVITGDIKFTETERNSRIFDDIVLLAKKLAGATADSGCGPTSKSYRIKYDRSTIKVTATNSEGKELGSKVLIVGPIERLSLGIDLPVSNRKTLKYDGSTNSLVPKNSDNQLFISFNIAAGDVLTKPQELPWQERLEFKILVKASSHPLDSYGVGIGYKLPPIAKIDLQGLSIFGGYFAEKEDSVTGTTPQIGQHTRRLWRFGVSYDLSTALKWAKF